MGTIRCKGIGIPPWSVDHICKEGKKTNQINCCKFACGPYKSLTWPKEKSKGFAGYIGGYPVMFDKDATTVPSDRDKLLRPGGKFYQGSMMCHTNLAALQKDKPMAHIV